MSAADLLVDAVTAAATSLLVTWLHRRVFCGPRGSRWCHRCWARAVVLMDGWNTCLHCGDSAWRHQQDLTDEVHRVPVTVGGETRAPVEDPNRCTHLVNTPNGGSSTCILRKGHEGMHLTVYAVGGGKGGGS